MEIASMLSAVFLVALAVGYAVFLYCARSKRAVAASASQRNRWVLLEIERKPEAGNGTSWEVREIRNAA